MQVFLSWSGAESKRAADALGPWLASVCPGLQVWMSAHDIPAGTPWGTALHEQLRCTDFGVVCLTPENLTAPWILYEAGALAMSSKVGCVVPFLLDVGPEELPAPLAQFQSVPANKEGAWKVVRSIMNAQGGAASEQPLHQVFEQEWPTLARALGLSLRTELRGDVLVVTPSAMQMNSDEEVQGLGERIKVLVHRGHKKVVLNLAEVTMTSSMGISLMIRASTFWKQAAAVVLANVQPYVLHQLEGIGLVGHMKLFPTLDQALAYLDGPRGHADG